MKVALYEEGKYWDPPDIKRIFTSIESAKQAIPDGFEISDKGPFYDVYAEHGYLDRWAAIKEYEVE